MGAIRRKVLGSILAGAIVSALWFAVGPSSPASARPVRPAAAPGAVYQCIPLGGLSEACAGIVPTPLFALGTVYLDNTDLPPLWALGLGVAVQCDGRAVVDVGGTLSYRLYDYPVDLGPCPR